jgi:hypothetical protein
MGNYLAQVSIRGRPGLAARSPAPNARRSHVVLQPQVVIPALGTSWRS